MGLEGVGGGIPLKSLKVEAADKGKGGGGGNLKNDLLTTMVSSLRPGVTTGGVTPDNTVVVGGSMAEITKDLGRASALVTKHGIPGSAGQQLQELSRRIKAGEIDWLEALEG